MPDHSTPTPTRYDREPPLFWARVDCSGGPSACWPWLGRTDEDGYGKAGGDRAHRIAYRLTKGPIPPGHEVCHTCDNRPCCNGEHLFADTHAGNMADMIRKGRSARHVPGVNLGERNGRAKLTADLVRQLRIEHASNGTPKKVLARAYGLDDKTVRDIISHRRWPHVD